jgi:hypothetical protein
VEVGDLQRLHAQTRSPVTGSTLIAPGSIGIVQKRPDGAMPGLKSCTCVDRSPTVPVKRSIN